MARGRGCGLNRTPAQRSGFETGRRTCRNKIFNTFLDIDRTCRAYFVVISDANPRVSRFIIALSVHIIHVVCSMWTGRRTCASSVRQVSQHSHSRQLRARIVISSNGGLAHGSTYVECHGVQRLNGIPVSGGGAIDVGHRCFGQRTRSAECREVGGTLGKPFDPEAGCTLHCSSV